jgi:hypothetical protein
MNAVTPEPSANKNKKNKKKLRVAVGFTGAAAACVGVFAPATEAQAAGPAMPYHVFAEVTKNIKSVQLCGYQSPPPGHWSCTTIRKNPGHSRQSSTDVFGGGWRYGKFNLWVWGTSGKEYGHTCNTNNAWTGSYDYSYSGGPAFGLTFDTGNIPGALGRSTVEC